MTRFTSGAVYPTYAFPTWMKWIAAVDPFTYAVHAFKSLTLKDTGLGTIAVLAGGHLGDGTPAASVTETYGRADIVVSADRAIIW